MQGRCGRGTVRQSVLVVGYMKRSWIYTLTVAAALAAKAKRPAEYFMMMAG